MQLERLTAAVETEAEFYRFSNASWQKEPFEGRHPVSYTATAFRAKRSFPKGTIVARLDQKAARVLLHALEPKAPDSFASWGFFDAAFEQKEYGEDYVLEPMAEKMLSADPALRREFDARIAADTAFAHSPGAKLNFFYERSPYWDDHVMLYPVARILKPAAWPAEPAR